MNYYQEIVSKRCEKQSRSWFQGHIDTNIIVSVFYRLNNSLFFFIDKNKRVRLEQSVLVFTCKVAGIILIE